MKRNHIFSLLLVFTCNFLFSQSPEILLNGTVSAEESQIKNVADPTDPGDAINKGYLSQMFESLQSQIDGLEAQAEDLQSQIDSINGVVKVVISGLTTAGAQSNARIYFESIYDFDGQDNFDFVYGAYGWQGYGGNSLANAGLNPKYIISQILAMVPSDGSVLLPGEFISYFSVGDTFSSYGLSNILTVDDYVITDFNSSINFDVRTNDADLEGEELTVSLLEGPESGTLTLNEDSTFSFIPATGFSGEVQFTYSVTDGTNTADGLTKIKVRPDTQPQNNVVFTGITTAGSSGTTARFYFESISSFDGIDHFDISYGASGWQGSGGNTLIDQGLNPNYIISQILAIVPNDGSVLTSGQFITYFSVGDAFSFNGSPNVIAVDDYFDVFFQTEITIDVTTNDADLEGEELIVSIDTPPSSGILISNAPNTFSFTPAADFSGMVQFAYQVSDMVNTDIAQVRLFVQPENEPQETVVISNITTAGAQSTARLYFESNSSLSGQDNFDFSYGAYGWQGSGGNSLTDVGLNPNYIISQILATVPSDGSVLLPGEFVNYFSVGDTFSFSGLSNILTVNDYIITDFNTSINFDVTTNDADLEGEELIVTLLDGPASGTLTLNEDGTFSFTPATDFSGEVQFTYEVTDGENVAGATSTIKVRDENFD